MNLDKQRGLRIREERDKRDWSQQQAADAVGLSREMWAKYEAGAEPGAKALERMAAAHVDVLYVLTGTPSGVYASLAQVRAAQGRAMPPEGSLSRRAAALVANYEAADESGKKIIEGTASMAAQPKPAKPSLQAGDNSHQYVGDHGIQIGGAAGAVNINRKGKK